MGTMSASDAAPLPRLGEVFFDVRGSSRSMRLSWYADTGVSVFSIWQGGTCTGTFRLALTVRTEEEQQVLALARGSILPPPVRAGKHSRLPTYLRHGSITSTKMNQIVRYSRASGS